MEIENRKESLVKISRYRINTGRISSLKKSISHFEDCYNIVKNCSFDNKDQRFQNCWLKKDNFPELIQKLETSLSIDRGFFENMNIFKYSPQQIHGPFLDSYNTESDSGKKNTRVGQRLYSIVIPLSQDLIYEFRKQIQN